MNPFSIIDAIKQHGTTGLLVVAVIYLHTRLNGVEEKLYRCYDDVRYKSAGMIPSAKTEFIARNEIYAVLPNELKIKREV